MAISKRKQRYLDNKKAKCGEVIICPICGEEFKKKQYSQAFCCTQCKDKYHNDKGDRHDVFYYSEYNRKHPERLERIKHLDIFGCEQYEMDPESELYDYNDSAIYQRKIFI